jgi:hypothetical protein
MKSVIRKIILLCAATAWAASTQNSQAAPIIFADFNVNEGTFASAPSFSGSNANVASSSTADRVTTDAPKEGAGHQKLVLVPTTEGNSLRLRHLSGGGTPGNNIAFNTSSGEDGWIGFYVKTTEPGWTVQIWIEGPSHNGSVPKDVIADGEWHLYEWNLDDNSGGADGWGSISGIIGGSATVSDGSHTIDSVLFRHGAAPASSTLFMDYIAKTDSGSVANLLEDPCINTSGVAVTGPVSADSSNVVVLGVDAAATAIKVYQDSGSGMVNIGSKTSGITAGENIVTVSGLTKGALGAATQTVNGQESCVPGTGKLVGGGANPSTKIAFSIRESSGTGPIGADGTGTGNSNIHHLGSSTRFSSAPGQGQILQPSTEWQTVTFQRGVDPSIGWNGTATDSLNNIQGDWAILDAIAIAIDDFTDSGPFDIYVDALQNGTTVFEDFEAADAGTPNYSFWYPNFAGQSQSAVLDNPNQSIVSDLAAFSGSKSLRVRFQWSGLDNTKWVRLSTSAPPNGLKSPLVNLNEPITIRFLVLPVGATPPPPSTPPVLSYSINGNQITFTWTGTFNLQEASTVTGSWETISGASGHQVQTTGATKFFRLISQ